MSIRQTVLALFIVSCGAAAVAQAPSARGLAAALRVPIHAAPADDVGGEYGVWGAGQNYKASFHDGMTFVPFLGRDLDSQKLSWRTVSCRVGSVELAVGDPVGRRVSDYRYEYDLGSVVEAYDLRADGLEQTFLITDRPAAAGDLVVTGAIGGTVFAMERSAQNAPVTFLGSDGAEVIGYGAAIAIDAIGEEFPMTTMVRGDGEIDLRLDAASVERAQFPLVVDPLLTNNIFASAPDIDEIDVFQDHQETNESLWAVYSVYASTSDRDLLVQRHERDFSGSFSTIYSDLAAQWSTTGGRIAGVGNEDDGRTVTVFTREFTSNSRRVRWHIHHKDNWALSTGVGSMPHVSNTQEWRPDVGGSYSPNTGDTALVVYQRDDGSTFQNGPRSVVRGVEIDVRTHQVVGSTFAIGGGIPFDAERPAINAMTTGGTSFSWIVVWQSHNNHPAGRWEVKGRRIGVRGTGNSTRQTLAAGADHAITPRIAGMFGRYVLHYGTRPFSSDKPLTEECRTVEAQRIQWTNGSAPSNPFPGRTLWTGAATTLRVGDCGYDFGTHSHWVATLADHQPGSEQLRFSKLGFDGGEIESGAVYQVPGWIPTPGAVSFDRGTSRYPIVFAVDSGSASDLLWGTHAVYEPVAAPSSYGAGCGLVMNQSFRGLQHLGGEDENFEVATPMTNTLGMVAFAVAPGAAPLGFAGMPGCELLVDGSAMIGTAWHVTNNLGGASQRLAIPSALQPFTIYSQWFLLVSGANPAGVVASPGFAVPFAR